MSAPNLPVIDVSVFRTGGEALDRTVEAVDRACTEIGFFAAVGHGIDPRLSGYLFDRAAAFFSRPLDEKLALDIGRSDNHTGYVAIGEERLQADLEPDMKEAIDIALEPEALLPAGGPGLPPVSQLPDVEHFDATVIAYQRAVLEAAAIVLRGIALALSLRPGFFERVMRRPQCNLRLLHYPPVPAAARSDDRTGCGAHTDYGLVTLLCTDGTPGLEVRRRDGEWMPAEVPPGALVVNLGDMLARWTNDRYVSTPHRVTNPTDRDRYSVPFFVNPDPDTVVASLPSCVSASNPSRYEPVRAADYLASRFDETHAYRGMQTA